MIETLKVGDQLLAVIVSRDFNEAGIHFFTPDDLSQQLAYMRHPAGKVIDPHIHNPVSRNVQFTQEVLFIKRGRLRVDFYDNDQRYIESRVLQGGDVILLATGGHGFEVGGNWTSQVSPNYEQPFEFTGTFDSVVIEISGEIDVARAAEVSRRAE